MREIILRGFVHYIRRVTMHYIMSNIDRLALIELFKIANDVTMTGVELDDLLDRMWLVMAMKNDTEGFVGRGATVSAAVAEWFKKADIYLPLESISLYELKEEYNGT